MLFRSAGLGKSVMNCGSMNARALAGAGVFYLPDPWCNNEPAWPTEIEVFKTVMAKLVQESTRGVALGVNEWLPFVTFLLRHAYARKVERSRRQRVVVTTSPPNFRKKGWAPPRLYLVSPSVHPHSIARH